MDERTKPAFQWNGDICRKNYKTVAVLRRGQRNMGCRSRRLLASLMLLFPISQFANANETLILDNEASVLSEKLACIVPETWFKVNSLDIKQNGCDRVKNCPEAMSQLGGCSLGSTEVLNFEIALMTELAARQECSGITVASYRGATKPSPTDGLRNSPHWSLQFNFAPGAMAQKWEMFRNKNGSDLDDGSELSIFRGEGDVQSMATRLCSIIKGTGAKVLN